MIKRLFEIVTIFHTINVLLYFLSNKCSLPAAFQNKIKQILPTLTLTYSNCSVSVCIYSISQK